MIELKPCPFCGGKVKHKTMYGGTYRFTCEQCGLNATWQLNVDIDTPDKRKLLVKRWNTRVNEEE